MNACPCLMTGANAVALQVVIFARLCAAAELKLVLATLMIARSLPRTGADAAALRRRHSSLHGG